jgi:hypothetical protein
MYNTFIEAAPTRRVPGLQKENEMKKGEYLVREEYRVVFFDGVEYFDIDGPFASAEEAEEALQRAKDEWAQSHPDE